MNTPEPCDNCKYLYVNCMCSDDPSYGAECLLNRRLGNPGCTMHQVGDSVLLTGELFPRYKEDPKAYRQKRKT